MCMRRVLPQLSNPHEGKSPQVNRDTNAYLWEPAEVPTMAIAGLQFLLFLPGSPLSASSFTGAAGPSPQAAGPPLQATMLWSQEAELSSTVTSKTKRYPPPCPPPHAPVPPQTLPTARSRRQPVCASARARERAPAAAHGRRVGPHFPPSAKIYIEPQINFIIFSSLIMPTSAARPKLCTCILIHPSPSSLSALNFSVIIVRRRAPFCGRERRRLAAGRSMQSEVQAALGRQGPCLDCRQLSGPWLVAALVRVPALPQGC